MGRPAGGGRALVESAYSLGAVELARRGELRRDGQAVTLSATFQPHDKPIPVRASVAVEWEPCRFGGQRPWFRCPRCGARRARMFLRVSGVACRKCHGLAYHSQRLDASARAHRRGMRLMQRLGLSREEAHRVSLEPRRGAPKPPRMRWATFDRIVDEAEAAETARWEALMPSMERFLTRMERARA